MPIDTPEVRARLEGWFRTLSIDNYDVKSRQTKKYNCIAWTFGKKNKWWEAGDYPGYFWPDGIPEDGSTKALIALYESYGYERCGKDASLEEGNDKVAIYYDDDGYTHGARQLPSGLWTSKLGRFEDIIHSSLEALCGDSDNEYGKLLCIMKRSRHDEEKRPAVYPRKKGKRSVTKK